MVSLRSRMKRVCLPSPARRASVAIGKLAAGAVLAGGVSTADTIGGRK